MTARTFYVDATLGSDSNNGLSSNAPLKSFAQLQSLLGAGDTVNLKAGQTWYDDLWIDVANVTVQSYGTGANPVINGDNGSRSGLIVTAESALIRNIDITGANNGLYITGANASATVIGGNFTGNGTGIVAGGGGQLVLADGVNASGNLSSLGAGDGIQIGADADAGTHTIINSVLNGNAIAGVNAKAGTVTVSDSTLSFNGGCGWIAQAYTDVFNIRGSRIEGNNKSDLGVGQASIEDSAIVYSTDNLYLNPNNGRLGTVQINMVESAGWTPGDRDRAEALYSSGDTFTFTSGQATTIGAIRVNTNDKATIVSIEDATFNHAALSGIAIDAYGATNLDLSIADSTFNMANTRAVRVNAASDFGAGLGSNTFKRADGGVVFEVQDTEYYTPIQVANLVAKYGEPAPAGSGNQAPTGMTLSAHAVGENLVGAAIGLIAVSDPDGDSVFKFTVSDPRFEVIGPTNQLKLVTGAALDYDAARTVDVTITATDPFGASLAKKFTINVVDGVTGTGATIDGSAGNDVIGAISNVPGGRTATGGADTVLGKAGHDWINGLDGDDILYGDSGKDRLEGDAGNDTLLGGTENDSLSGGVGDDILNGEQGNDILLGGTGNDTLIISGSDALKDTFDGGAGTDALRVAGTGPATLAGFNAAMASIESWIGNDAALLGTSASDTFDFRALNSASGLTYVDAGRGADLLFGTRFADDLRGDADKDRLEGGAGNDVLSGGAGSDTFVFKQGFGNDRITDFTATRRDADIIDFQKNVFANYAAVTAAAKQSGADVVITASDGSSLILSKMTLAQLAADDFRFT